MKENNEVTSAAKNKIDPNKKYRKVNSYEPVRVICTDRVTYNNQFPVVALIAGADGREEFWGLDDVGVSAAGNKIIEEIPQTDWSKVQVDSPIWVCGWPVHFARFDAEKQVIQYYHEGKTSHSNELKILGWNLPENCSLEKPNA